MAAVELGRGKYTKTALDRFQRQGDPLADAVIAGLDGRVRGNLLVQVEKRARREGGAYADFLDTCHTIPRWANFVAMEPGRRLGFKYAPLVGLALLAGSLVEGYALGRQAQVLATTGRLTQDVRRRLYETTEFMYQLGRPRGAQPGQPGHRGVMKVRLLHAMVRHHVIQRGHWDTAAQGSPISQEDMAATLTEFSHQVRRGLERLGVRVTQEEADSHHLFWQYIGHGMGLDSALLTRTREDERALYEVVTRRQRLVTPQGVALARSTLDAMAAMPPFYLPRPVLYQISRRLLGNELADALELPRSRMTSPALGALALSAGAMVRTEHAMPGVGTLLYHAGHLYARRYIDSLLAGTAPDYAARFTPANKSRPLRTH